MEFTTLKFEEVESGIGMLTLNRPDQLNAITRKMLEELYALFHDLNKRKDLRVLIITGAGRGFCAGPDIEEAFPSSAEGLKSFSSASVHLEEAQKIYAGIVVEMRRLAQPIIAAIKGPAAGAGMSIALASDIIIAAPSAKFTPSFINIGLSGGDLGSTYFLPRMIGYARASEILMTGRTVSAEEAERIGLVSRLVEENKLIDSAMETARTLIKKTPLGLRLTKEALKYNLDVSSFEAAIEFENKNQSILCCAPEFYDAFDASINRR